LSRSIWSSLSRLARPLETSEEQRRLLAADAGHRNDRHGGLAGESHEAFAATEVDDVPLPRRAENLVGAARIHQHGGAGLQCQPGIFLAGCHGAELAKPAQRRIDGDKVVRELVERPLRSEIGVERQTEDEGVRRHVAAAVVAHQQHRSLGWYAIKPSNIGPEIQRRQQPEAGHSVADVVGVALV
jgi:hypothetical protein